MTCGAGLSARPIVDDDVATYGGRTSDHVPGGGHVLGALDPFDIRRAARCDDDHVRLQRQHVVGLGERIEVHVDTEALELGTPPIDDADDVAPPTGPRGQYELPAELVGGL